MNIYIYTTSRALRGRDGMIVGFTTTYAISAYRHWCCEFESRSGRGVQHYVIRVCHWLATGWWFSPGPPVSSTNKTDRHDITEILLKVALSAIKQSIYHEHLYLYHEHCRNIAHWTLKQHTTNQLWIKIMFLQNECMAISWKY